MVRSITFVRVADWLNAYVVRQHPDKETLRQKLDGRGRPLGGPRRMGPHRRAGREEPGRARPPGAARSHRVRDGRRRSGSAMDDEHHACGNRHPLPQASASGPSPSARSWGSIGTIPCRRAARPPSPRSGSAKWCVGRGDDGRQDTAGVRREVYRGVVQPGCFTRRGFFRGGWFVDHQRRRPGRRESRHRRVRPGLHDGVPRPRGQHGQYRRREGQRPVSLDADRDEHGPGRDGQGRAHQRTTKPGPSAPTV